MLVLPACNWLRNYKATMQLLDGEKYVKPSA